MKKFLCLLISAATLTGLLSVSGPVSFASGPVPEIGYIDTSNPYSFHISSEKKASGAKASKAPSRSASLPSQYDSRDYGYITPVRNQGNTSTCWAHATMASIEGYELANGISQPGIDYSESHLIWFTGNPRDISGNSNAKDGENDGAEAYDTGGNWFRATITLANSEGINNDSDYPLYPYGPSQYPFTESDRYTHTSGRGICDVEQPDTPEEIKQAIMSNGAVTICFASYDDYFLNVTTEGGHTYYSYCCDNNYGTNHAVALVGWDDSYPASRFGVNPGANGAWLAKESWGTNSKDNGYFWISYADPTINDYTSFTTRSFEDNYRTYSYTSAENGGYFTQVNQYANVYTCTGYELLSTVGIFNYTPESTITIDIYKNPVSGNPSRGTKVGTATRYLDNEGYFTFEFSDIPLNPNDKFSAVVTVSSSNEIKLPTEVPLPQRDEYGNYVLDENNNPVMVVDYTANTGESYIGAGNLWYDTVSSGAGNCFIFVNTKCNHNLVTEETASTCSVHGYITSYCTQCGYSNETELPLLEHTYVYRSQTNLEESIDYRECQLCGNTEIIARRAVIKPVTLAELIQRIIDLIMERLFMLKN